MLEIINPSDKEYFKGHLNDREMLVLTFGSTPAGWTWQIRHVLARWNPQDREEWITVTPGESFSGIGSIDYRVMLESVNGFETDMARTVGREQAQWHPWQQAFDELKKSLQEKIDN